MDSYGIAAPVIARPGFAHSRISGHGSGARCFLRLNKPGIHTAYVETECDGIVNRFDPFEFTVLPEQGEAEHSVSGYVAVDGIPQGNAEVALISEDDDKVGYYAVTDVHGYYNMPVIQHERMYTASVNSDATFEPVVGIKIEAPKTVNFFIGESIVTGGTVHDEVCEKSKELAPRVRGRLFRQCFIPGFRGGSLCQAGWIGWPCPCAASR